MAAAHTRYWMLYAAGAAYSVMPSVQWLLASQAFTLSFTALPIWWLAQQAGLTPRRCWLMCSLWWLQPVVFNTNLFDFHPETWVMPLFALALWAERAERLRLWLLLLLLLLGSRDGLVLIVGGMAIDLAWRGRWRWSASAAGLSIAWLLMLSRWLYPLLRNGEDPKQPDACSATSAVAHFRLFRLDWAEVCCTSCCSACRASAYGGSAQCPH